MINSDFQKHRKAGQSKVSHDKEQLVTGLAKDITRFLSRGVSEEEQDHSHHGLS